MAELRSRLLALLLLFVGAQAAWIGEEYWARVHDDGTLAEGTRPDVLIRFDAMHHGVTMENAYIAFWIHSDTHVPRHYETFGHAFIDENGRMSARFIGPHGHAMTRRGGFHVLRRSITTGENPFRFTKAGDADPQEAVGYLDQSVAMLLNENHDEAFFGWVRLADRLAGGVNFDDKVVKVDGNAYLAHFDQNIYVLTSESLRADEAAAEPAASRREEEAEAAERQPYNNEQSYEENPLRNALMPAKRQTHQFHPSSSNSKSSGGGGQNCNCGTCQDCGQCINCETRNCPSCRQPQRKPCQQCESCEECPECENCRPCPKCKQCKQCERCPDCQECPECPDCPNCRECPDCKPCKKCEQCKECKECPKCADCPNCRECPDCKPCKQCEQCKECPGCPQCEDCPSCRDCPDCEACPNCQQCEQCKSCGDCPQSQPKPCEQQRSGCQSNCGSGCQSGGCGSGCQQQQQQQQQVQSSPCRSNCGDRPCGARKRSPAYPALPPARKHPRTTPSTTPQAEPEPQQQEQSATERRCNSCGCQDYPAQQPPAHPHAIRVFTPPPSSPQRTGGCRERQHQQALQQAQASSSVTSKPIGCRRTKREIDFEYWVMVDRYGNLESDRTKGDLLQFDAIHKRAPDNNAYIALWNYEDEGASDSCVQRESFGHAYYDRDRLVARFIDNNDQPRTMVGGFYVLARSKRTGRNPFVFMKTNEMQPTEDEYPAKIASYQRNEAWFGSVDIGARQARGVDYHGKVHKICGFRDPNFFNNSVYALKKMDVVELEDYESDVQRAERQRQQYEQQRQEQERRRRQQDQGQNGYASHPRNGYHSQRQNEFPISDNANHNVVYEKPQSENIREERSIVYEELADDFAETFL